MTDRGIRSFTQTLPSRVMREQEHCTLNATIVGQITKVWETNPSADLELVLKKAYVSYARLRQVAKKGAANLREGAWLNKEDRTACSNDNSVKDSDREEDLTPVQAQPRPTPRAPQPAAIVLRPLLSSVKSSPAPYTIIHELSPLVYNALGIPHEGSSEFSSELVRRVSSFPSLWQSHSRAVIDIGNNVVTKVSQNLDHDEHDVLRFVEKHLPVIMAPRALGLITIGPTSFMFMTLVPGVSLESRWPSLSCQEKEHIQAVLNEQLLALRGIPHPPGSPLGCPVGRRVCKDVRRHDHVSTLPIYSEAEFNDFLIESPLDRSAPGYKRWLRSMLRTDHDIVFTHADFHPRNLIVVDRPGCGIELSGIIDWETSGFYPSYWEQLKAMNTHSSKDTSDWWDYLPQCIKVYDQEVVLDRMIESTLLY